MVQTPCDHMLKQIILEPVYATKDTNELVYDSRMMKRKRDTILIGTVSISC